MKIGLYGGTFDPVHNGHLILARDAIEYLNLDKLVFVPNNISPHKLAGKPAPAPLRRRMLAAAIQDEPRFEVDDSELRRAGPSFTIDTVVEMKQRHERARFFYLVGEDNLAELHTWRRIDELRQMVEFVVLSREPSETPHPFVTLRRRIDVSATEIRERVAKGLSIRYFVPDAALDIIIENQLYREEPK